MEVKTKTVKTITLELTEEERDWIHGVMQNPLHGLLPTEEGEQDAKMRRLFFENTFSGTQ